MNQWNNLATERKFEEAIAMYVHDRPGTSFVELENDFAPFLETRGDYSLHQSNNDNIVYWAGMDENFAKHIENALRNKKIFVHATQLLVYIVDGKTLKFPLVKKPNAKYKHPHWLPVSLSSK